MAIESKRVTRFNKEFAALIRRRRLELGISQFVMAQELGLDQAAVSRSESGDRTLGLGEAMLWLETLGLHDREILSQITHLWNEYGSRSESFWRGTEL